MQYLFFLVWHFVHNEGLEEFCYSLTTGLKHFGWSCFPVRRWGRVCLLFGSSRSKLSSMDSRKPTFMSCALKPVPLRLRMPFPQALKLSGGARFIAGHLRDRRSLEEYRRGSRHFWNRSTCIGWGSTLDYHNKKGHVPHSRLRGVLDKYRIRRKKVNKEEYWKNWKCQWGGHDNVSQKFFVA